MFLERTRLHGLPLVIRPQLARVVFGNEHDRVQRLVLIDVGQVVVEVLSPEAGYFKEIVEDFDTRVS